MEELNFEFNNYVEEFKKLSVDLKMQEIITSIKELISFIDFLASTKNIELKYLKSNELLDLKKDDVSVDDYLEAILVYVEVVKNLIAQYLDSPAILNDNN